MRVSDVQHRKNKTGLINLADLTVEITILDIREVWGQIQYLITPVAGTGSTWVFATRVTIKELRLCALCNGPISNNPHPNAGKAGVSPDYLEIGTAEVCIPCTVKSRHQWTERAMKAEGKIGMIFRELKEATCHGQDKLSLADIETIEKESSK